MKTLYSKYLPSVHCSIFELLQRDIEGKYEVKLLYNSTLVAQFGTFYMTIIEAQNKLKCDEIKS